MQSSLQNGIVDARRESDSSLEQMEAAGNTQILVDRARASNESAWHEIYRRYRAALVLQVQAQIPSFALRRFDAEDVLQAAFIKAWTRLSSFEYRGRGSFRGWLSRLVVREFQNALKSQALERSLRSMEENGPRLTELTDHQEHPDEQLVARTSLLEQMNLLRREDRDILTMRHYENMSFADMAEVLGCSRECARSLYTRALGRLSRRLKV